MTRDRFETAKPGELSQTLSQAMVHLAYPIFKHHQPSDQWVELIRKTFLRPYGLEHRSWGGVSPLLPRKDWPTLVVSSALIHHPEPWQPTQVQLLQWTPYYGGIKTQCQLDHQVFGGGFDALTQIDANNQQQGDGFDLAHMMAYSSAFFAKACARAWVPRHWIPTYAHRASIPLMRFIIMG